jgi:hypothetical protein
MGAHYRARWVRAAVPNFSSATPAISRDGILLTVPAGTRIILIEGAEA